ncbi:hypothetical protein EJ110_NYTH58081 [Nymphaea thermarum]|nr:hypothetical protein EJ110_NYTH58081 [Nymphaea thermarum]
MKKSRRTQSSMNYVCVSCHVETSQKRNVSDDNDHKQRGMRMLRCSSSTMILTVMPPEKFPEMPHQEQSYAVVKSNGIKVQLPQVDGYVDFKAIVDTPRPPSHRLFVFKHQFSHEEKAIFVNKMLLAATGTLRWLEIRSFENVPADSQKLLEMPRQGQSSAVVRSNGSQGDEAMKEATKIALTIASRVVSLALGEGFGLGKLVVVALDFAWLFIKEVTTKGIRKLIRALLPALSKHAVLALADTVFAGLNKQRFC